MEYPAMKVGPLPPDRSRHAALVLADAFRDYPAWLAIAHVEAGRDGGC
jgi:hypothetical protein